MSPDEEVVYRFIQGLSAEKKEELALGFLQGMSDGTKAAIEREVLSDQDGSTKAKNGNIVSNIWRSTAGMVPFPSSTRKQQGRKPSTRVPKAA